MNKQKLLVLFLILIISSGIFYSFNNSGPQFVKTELYFGLAKGMGDTVSTEEWNAFEDTVIAKVFSSGSTTQEGKGKWLDGSGLVWSENSKVVSSLNEMTPELSEKIDSIREKYKKYYNQLAVLRVDYNVQVSF